MQLINETTFDFTKHKVDWKAYKIGEETDLSTELNRLRIIQQAGIGITHGEILICLRSVSAIGSRNCT